MAKRITPEEEDEIRRLYKGGNSTLKIEKITGRSHTTINQITKGLPRVSSSTRPSPLPVKSIKIPPRSQVPSPPTKICIPAPSGFYDPYQASYYSEPNQDQYQSQKPPIDSPPKTDKQDSLMQEYFQKSVERSQRDGEQRDRENEEWQTQIKQINELKNIASKQEIEQSLKHKEDAEIWELRRQLEQQPRVHNYCEKILQEIRSQREKASKTPVQPETMQPSTMTPAQPTEPKKNNTTELKEIPVKEIPTQPSAENKPGLVSLTGTIPQNSLLQDLRDLSNDNTPYNHLEPPKKISPAETTQNDASESNEDPIEISDGILLGGILGLSDCIKNYYRTKYGFVFPPSSNKKTNKTKKNTKSSSI